LRRPETPKDQGLLLCLVASGVDFWLMIIKKEEIKAIFRCIGRLALDLQARLSFNREL